MFFLPHPPRRTMAYALFCVLPMALSGCADTSRDVAGETAWESAQAPASSETHSSAAPSEVLSKEPSIPSEEQLRREVASLLMVGVRDFDDARFALSRGVGGIFIGSDTNPELLTTPGRDLAALRAEFGDFDASIDFEGGRVLRHADILGTYPSPRTMTQTLAPEQVRDLAREMGQSLASHGITVNFAPVLDLDGAGLDVVGDRSFSSDPARTAAYASAYAQGMLDAGVRPVFKHFPGHGRASGDSHFGQVVTPPLAEVHAFELAPYAQALDIQGVGVMMGHMIVPDLGQWLPSSLNPAAYTLLRQGDYDGGKLFDGVVYTDDLLMQAIDQPLAGAVAAALAAGADQALWISTQDLDVVINTVKEKVIDGSFPYDRVLASRARLAQR